MESKRIKPKDPIKFIRDCVSKRNIYWTYHINMRSEERAISRLNILNSIHTYELIESYPEDKYYPSYLVWARSGDETIHILFATDIDGNNVRVITTYRPNPEKWDHDLKRRIK